jgi:hypothetical protein
MTSLYLLSIRPTLVGIIALALLLVFGAGVAILIIVEVLGILFDLLMDIDRK